MKQSKFPDGWDEDRIRRVMTSYEQQDEDAAVAEDEAAVESSATVMSVPFELVPKIRELIAKRNS
jgi:hypothetical protein